MFIINRKIKTHNQILLVALLKLLDIVFTFSPCYIICLCICSYLYFMYIYALFCFIIPLPSPPLLSLFPFYFFFFFFFYFFPLYIYFFYFLFVCMFAYFLSFSGRMQNKDPRASFLFADQSFFMFHLYTRWQTKSCSSSFTWNLSLRYIVQLPKMKRLYDFQVLRGRGNLQRGSRNFMGNFKSHFGSQITESFGSYLDQIRQILANEGKICTKK